MRTSEPLPLILASGSPRRRELIERFWDPQNLLIMIPQFNEVNVLTEKTGAKMLAGQIAAGKMTALHSQFQLPDQYAAITADTIVVLEGEILGKPVDEHDAVRMLHLLSGKTHQVITGISLDAEYHGEIFCQQAVEVTNVLFCRLKKEQISWYAATGESFDKAGAYGIQGYGAALIKKIDGCYYNVMGLPVNRLMVLLQRAASHFSSNSSFTQLLPWN